MDKDIPLVSVIVPTYNEAENINILLDRVHNVLKNYYHEIIIVDDNSPDRTWELVLKRRETEEWLRLIKRKSDKGLSKAVVEGFEKSRGQYLAVIDADLQHDERILPSLIEQVRFVPIAIGSRYMKGGDITDWPLARRIFSFLATQFASLLLNILISDPMSGFFASTLPMAVAIAPAPIKIILFIAILYQKLNTILPCIKI